MKQKLFALFALLAIALMNISSAQPPVNGGVIDLAGTGHITYLDHKWSFTASVVRVEEVSALGSRGHAALLTYLDRRNGDANYGWVLLDLEGYDYHPANEDVRAGQKVLLYVSGNYVNEYGIDYSRCSIEAGDYCTVLALVEGAYPKSIDMYNLPVSPGNELINHGSSSRNWWTGMLAWKIAVQ
jgi:hypothetical protein